MEKTTKMWFFCTRTGGLSCAENSQLGSCTGSEAEFLLSCCPRTAPPVTTHPGQEGAKHVFLLLSAPKIKKNDMDVIIPSVTVPAEQEEDTKA